MNSACHTYGTIVTDSRVCCFRCKEQPPRICCGVCESRQQLSFCRLPPLVDVDSSTTTTPARRQTKVKLPNFTMDAHDTTLKHRLTEWRKETAARECGGRFFFGTHVILPQPILQRIVELAHHGRLVDQLSLHTLAGWHANLVKRYGAAVLAIVQQCAAPTPPPLPSPPPPLLASSSQPLPSKTRATRTGVRKCKGCGSLEHIGTSPLFFCAY